MKCRIGQRYEHRQCAVALSSSGMCSNQGSFIPQMVLLNWLSKALHTPPCCTVSDRAIRRQAARLSAEHKVCVRRVNMAGCIP